MKTKQVTPYGMLYTQGREYFLLHPHPVVKDWEGDNAYRFLVTPRINIKNKIETSLDIQTLYSYARHIVTNAFAIDFVDGMPEITILDLEQEILND